MADTATLMELSSYSTLKYAMMMLVFLYALKTAIERESVPLPTLSHRWSHQMVIVTLQVHNVKGNIFTKKCSCLYSEFTSVRMYVVSWI